MAHRTSTEGKMHVKGGRYLINTIPRRHRVEFFEEVVLLEHHNNSSNATILVCHIHSMSGSKVPSEHETCIGGIAATVTEERWKL